MKTTSSPKKNQEMVWPVDNYTDKLHFAIREIFRSSHWLAFSTKQMRERLIQGYNWLKVENDRQSIVLEKVISTGFRKLEQHGHIQQVKSNLQTERQFQWAKTAAESGYKVVTTSTNVATSEVAKKLVKRRAVSIRTLWKANNGQITGTGNQ